MDDDRPIQPDDRPLPRDPLAGARAGDLDAFVELLRPRVGRLLRLASIAAGDEGAAEQAAAAALRAAWRDARRIRDVADLDPLLERALVARLPRRRPGGTAPLDRALRGLPPAERLALARCLDAHPDADAFATAGRAGVEVPTVSRAGTTAAAITGDIVDLDGPLAGWDVPRLRAALAAASAPVDADRFLERAREDLAESRPDAEGIAELRALLPGPAVIARGLALVLAAAVGAGALAWTTSRPAADDGSAAGQGVATPAATLAPEGDGGGDEAAATELDTPGDFPAEIDGLPVLGVNGAKHLAGNPAVARRSIAIRGWLDPLQLREACAPALAVPARDGTVAPVPEPAPVDDPVSAAAAFCLREAVLREAPGTDWGIAHLHPQLLPGTGLGRLRRVFAAADGDQVPVVVIAHFGNARAASCAAGGRHCGEELVVDRIAWALGASSRPPTAILAPGTGAEALRTATEVLEIAEDAYASLRAVSVAGVPAAGLGLVEPAAADLVAAGGAPSIREFAWLVRAIVEPHPGDRPGAARTWLLVDDRTGAVVAAPGSVAGAGDEPGTGFLFPKRVDETLVRSVADARTLVETGLPEGAAIAVAGWLATPALSGACLAEAGGVDGPLDGRAAFCRRATTLRGPGPNGRGLALQLPPGTPSLPIDEVVAGRGMPVPVVALVQSGSPRSEPCWPTANGCGRALVLERLLWIDGSATDVAIAELDDDQGAPPRLAVAEVRAIAETAIAETAFAEAGRVVSIVRVPAARRDEVAPGSAATPVAGDHAWVVRVRSPMVRGGGATGLDHIWWLMVDDATGRPSTGSRSIARLPGATASARAG